MRICSIRGDLAVGDRVQVLDPRHPSALKFPITSQTRSSLVKATLAIAGTSIPCADSCTICARR